MLYDVAYIQYTVADLEKAVGFYRDTLGMDLLWFERNQGHAALDTSAGPLVLHADPAGKPGGASPVLAFEVADIVAMVDDLTAKGIEFPAGVERHGGRVTARFRDPDGHTLELNTTMPHGFPEPAEP